jgi:RecA-family ATPase
MRDILLTKFNGLNAKGGVSLKTSYAQLRDIEKPTVVNNKVYATGTGYYQCVNGHRKDENVFDYDLMPMDFDSDVDEPNKVTLDELIKELEGYECFINPTWTHQYPCAKTEQKKLNKFRVTFNTSRTYNRQERKKMLKAFWNKHPRLFALVDKNSLDDSHFFFDWSCPQDTLNLHKKIILEGKPLGVGALLDNYNTILINYLQDNINLDGKLNPDIKADWILDNDIPDNFRTLCLTKLIGHYNAKGLPKEKTYKIVSGWNNNLSDPLDDNKIEHTLNSIYSLYESQHGLLENFTELPLPSLQTTETSDKIIKGFELVSVDHMVDVEPPPQEFIFDDLIPRYVVGALVAKGGTGKSYFMLQMLICGATGMPLYNKFANNKEMTMLYISGEDEAKIIWRRLYHMTKNLPERHKELIKKNVKIIDWHDKRYPFIRQLNKNSEYEISGVIPELVDLLINAYGETPIDMVLIDPVSRFSSGTENGNETRTVFVQACEMLRSKLNTTLFLNHHVNKASSEELTQDSSRGGSGFVDGIRLMLGLRKLTPKQVGEKFGAMYSDDDFVEFTMLKTNYTKFLNNPVYLKKDSMGMLEATELTSGEHKTLFILKEIQKGEYTKTKFRESFGGVGKSPLYMAEKPLVDKLESMEKEALISIPPNKSMEILYQGEDYIKREEGKSSAS